MWCDGLKLFNELTSALKEERNLERFKETIFFLVKTAVSCCVNKIICILSNLFKQNNISVRYLNKLLLKLKKRTKE
jgi:DNA-binding MltR family transcriptional regulator